jgi:hypothetical protein
MKRCSKCNEYKSLSSFGSWVLGKDGLQTWCKVCKKGYSRQYREINKSKLRIQQNNYYDKNRGNWRRWLEEIYGLPMCEICNRKLSHFSKTKKTTVCFDHKTGEEILDKKPSDWMAKTPCNEVNRELFSSCNFGILCNSCNRRIGDFRYRNKLYNYIKEAIDG